MRQLALSKSGLNKIKSNHSELKAADFESSVKSIPPGEWCQFTSPSESWFGFINPMIDDKYSCAHVLGKSSAELSTPEDYILKKINQAITLRSRFQDYKNSSRLFYGTSDGLPGLIIDEFENALLIQINTAGVDKFRNYIQSHLSKTKKKPTFLLDNAKYREKEFLPLFENPSLPDLEVCENGLKYKIRSSVLQKIGFYYDHRENRKHLTNLLLSMTDKPQTGLDLFSYAGSWGLNALKGGLKSVDFVDQGDFETEIQEGLTSNNFSGRGKFYRQDVFKFLDQSIGQAKKYDLLLCDPPAFAKSSLQKPQALEGYSKLHRKVIRLAGKGAICVFSSCTQYVSFDEFQKNVLDSAFKENRKLQLIHSGLQGLDHPVRSIDDRANYIKSFFYILE